MFLFILHFESHLEVQTDRCKSCGTKLAGAIAQCALEDLDPLTIITCVEGIIGTGDTCFKCVCHIVCNHFDCGSYHCPKLLDSNGRYKKGLYGTFIPANILPVFMPNTCMLFRSGCGQSQPRHPFQQST